MYAQHYKVTSRATFLEIKKNVIKMNKTDPPIFISSDLYTVFIHGNKAVFHPTFLTNSTILMLVMFSSQMSTLIKHEHRHSSEDCVVKYKYNRVAFYNYCV